MDSYNIRYVRVATPEERKKSSIRVKKDWKNNPQRRIKTKETIEKVRQTTIKTLDDPKVIENRKLGKLKMVKNKKWQEALQKRMTKCQVKEPGKTWRTFDCARDASKYYNWKALDSATSFYFPKDGSTKVATKKQFKGWQTRRLVKKG